jgi:TPR repeat protein
MEGARALFKRAAEQGDSNGQLGYGRLLMEGPDRRMGVNFLREAAGQNNRLALFEYG